MKRTKKLMISVFSTFIIMLGIIAISNTELIFAKEDNIFYLDDLNEGDFIPNGATIIGGKTYINQSAIHSEIDLIFYESENTSYPANNYTATLYDGNSYVVKKQSDYFLTGNQEHNYAGWIIKEMFFYSDDIVLIPVEKKVSVEELEYEIRANCSDGSTPTNTWYKVSEIPNPTIENKKNGIWQIENNTYKYIYVYMNLNEDITSKLKFNFNAKKGDYFIFELKTAGDIYYKFNEITGNLDYGYVSKGYKTEKFQVEKDGENEFILENLTKHNNIYNNIYYYLPNLFYLRNYRLLTPINEGDNLDTTKVESGDTVYYECECADGYIYNEAIEYINEEENTSDDNKENTINPETSSTIFYVSILMGLFISTGIIIKINSKKI